MNQDLYLLASDADEIQELIQGFSQGVTKEDLAFTLDSLIDGDTPCNIEGFGESSDIKKISEKVLKQWIPLMGKYLTTTESGRDVLTDEYYCYAKRGTKYKYHNIILHEDAGSALNCAISCIGSPTHIIILSKATDGMIIGDEEYISGITKGIYKAPISVREEDIPKYIYKEKKEKPQVVVDEDAVVSSLVVYGLPKEETEVLTEVPVQETIPETSTDSNDYFNMSDYGYGSKEADNSNNPPIHPESQGLGQAES